MPIPDKNTTVLTVEGQIERITFHNEIDHFTIAKLKVKGRLEPLTILGNFSVLNPGEVLKVNGRYEQHPRYGLQMRVESYESQAPATLTGIERYLGSGLIKGIGPEMAKRIVRHFGLKTLTVIENHPNQLSKVEGIGPKRAAQIKQAWKEQKEVRHIMIFLQSYGVSTGLAAKIFKTYGQAAMTKIRENPYTLAADIFGVGFLTADRIAQNMGVQKEAPLRIQAGLLHLLQQKSEEGHACFPEEALIEAALTQLEVNRIQVEQALAELLKKQQLRLQTGTGQPPLIFIPALDQSEEGIAERMEALLQEKSPPDPRLETAIRQAETSLKLHLSPEQKEALRAALKEKVTIITGGPGTGKTTLVRSILTVFRQIGKKMILMAPTGRAAKRLSEVTHYPAATIHRTLGFNPKAGKFQKDQDHPLAAEMVIIDEASMVDTYLMYHLLKAIPLAAQVILVGDVFQLPSVGPGNVLSDLIQSRAVPVIELKQIFRQAEGSLIVVNAHRIHAGEMPLFIEPDEPQKAEFVFLYQEDPEKAAQWILELVQKKIPRRYGLDPFQDIQVLTPMYKGSVGAENLNQLLQQQMNPEKRSVQRGPRELKIGDKVMQIRNNYEKEVFNGDIGRLSKIDAENQECWVNFDGRFVLYDFGDLDELTLAYAISVHKSQGSEYAAVIMPVMTQHFILLQRNLIYTAITRAKNLMVLVGTKKALAIGIKNNKPQGRYSFLKERLMNKGFFKGTP